MRSMVPLSVETDPWRALLSRTDIRMVDGILHIREVMVASTPLPRGTHWRRSALALHVFLCTGEIVLP